MPTTPTTPTSVEIPGIISVDDHVVEPPGIWQDRLPARYRDVGPEGRAPADGRRPGRERPLRRAPGHRGPAVAWWRYEDHYYSVKRYIAAVGVPPEEVDMYPITYDDMRPGCWQPKARLADMDMNGVEASLCFPNYPRFCGQIFLEAHDQRARPLLCVKAYNDWMVDEWCGDSGGRLIPLVPGAAVGRRTRRGRGPTQRRPRRRAVAFSELPPWLGLPSDPLRATGTRSSGPATRRATVVCMHIGSGTKTLRTIGRRTEAVGAAMIFTNSAASMLDFLMSGVLGASRTSSCSTPSARSAGSPTCSSGPTTCGAPTCGRTRTPHPELPSTYYRDRVLSCFFKDTVGVDLLDRIGVDQVLLRDRLSAPGRHVAALSKVAAELVGHLDPADTEKIVRGNAIRLFGLDLP